MGDNSWGLIENRSPRAGNAFEDVLASRLLLCFVVHRLSSFIIVVAVAPHRCHHKTRDTDVLISLNVVANCGRQGSV